MQTGASYTQSWGHIAVMYGNGKRNSVVSSFSTENNENGIYNSPEDNLANWLNVTQRSHLLTAKKNGLWFVDLSGLQFTSQHHFIYVCIYYTLLKQQQV